MNVAGTIAAAVAGSRGGGGGTTTSQENYPDYTIDEGLIRSFLLEHTVTVVLPPTEPTEGDSDDDIEDALARLRGEKPSSTTLTANIARVPAYPPLIRATRLRRFVDADLHNPVIQIPLSELRAWDGLKGGDLVQRIVGNTKRYVELFSTILDALIVEDGVTSEGETSE
eukprot:CAMPEP_0194376152 /NCGR_PEP_ID=MMETSP0174-20130528/24633_1 /TAXON_ID=216777 /ORGANISM="Proboscia alata, Strain PI-D3" /LENGTH=168 /DNA_ID=CAMNT_0039156723 /DNA_START=298 /DNA_END=801 /DNA_ORIENTATION=-